MFDQSVILSVAPPQYSGTQVFLSWVSSAADGTLYQVYLNGSDLAYEGTETSVWISVPGDGVSRCDIGAILSTDAGTDFSASLPDAPARRAKITWQGGLSLGADTQGFRVYWGGSPGTAVSYTTPIADLTAFPGGSPVDVGDFQWASDALASGTYHFGVKPYDVAGNEGTAEETTVTIAAPPGPPARFSTGERLRYSLVPNGTTPAVALTWNAVEHP